MIGRMRKEMKNLSYLWWIVLASLVAPSFLSRMNNNPSKKAVAQINGRTLDVARFKRQYMMMQSERQMFNQRYGLNLDLAVDPAAVIDRTADAMLLDDVARDQNFAVDPAILSAMIRKSLNALFGVRKDGFNLELYNYYIKQAGMTVREFEDEQEAAVRNSFVEDALHASAYALQAGKKNIHKDDKKSFALLRFSKDAYLKQAKNDYNVGDEEIAAYFAEYKNNYRLPDVKSASYVVADAASYAKQAVVTNEQIENFYNRRKDAQFKDKDLYRMRRLLIAVPEGATADEASSFKEKADEFYAKIMVNKDGFAEIVKTVSDDAKTAKKGGMTEEFTLGSYSPELEGALVALVNNGDVTPLVKTQAGFECAQLIQKKVGAYRSLDSARKEISSVLTQRVTSDLLKADVDSLMRDAQDGELDLAGFAKSRHSKLEETGLVEASVAQGDGLKSEIVKKIFGSFSEKPLLKGSFASGDKHVVFAVTASETDRYPAIDAIKGKIIEDIAKKVAADNLAKDVLASQKAFFDAHTSLIDLAHVMKNASLHETGMIKKADSIKGIEKEHSITTALFRLDDSSMLSKVLCKDGDIILATLVASQPYDGSDSLVGASATHDIKAIEENLVTGFIASLKRNARIEISDDQFSSAS